MAKLNKKKSCAKHQEKPLHGVFHFSKLARLASLLCGVSISRIHSGPIVFTGVDVEKTTERLEDTQKMSPTTDNFNL